MQHKLLFLCFGASQKRTVLRFVFCGLHLLIYTVHLSEVQCAFFREAQCFFAFCAFETCRGSKAISSTLPSASYRSIQYLYMDLVFTFISVGHMCSLRETFITNEFHLFYCLSCADHRVKIVYVPNMMWYSASICCWKTVFQADYEKFLKRKLTRNKSRAIFLLSIFRDFMYLLPAQLQLHSHSNPPHPLAFFSLFWGAFLGQKDPFFYLVLYLP